MTAQHRTNLRSSVADRLRAEDDRIPYVERAFIAIRLGLMLDEVELLDDVVNQIVVLPQSVVNTIGASRLLEHLDAHVARQNPTSVEYPEPGMAVAHVALDSEEITDVYLSASTDGLTVITLEHDVDPCRRELTVDDAERLAHALLRLVQLHRSSEQLEETDQ